MKSAAIVLLVQSALFIAGAARAEPLTCEVFQARLEQGIGPKRKLVTAADFTPVEMAGAAGRRFDWKRMDLSGSLQCGADHEFQGFVADAANDVAQGRRARLSDLQNIASSAICALAATTRARCDAVARSMLNASLARFGKSRDRKLGDPVGRRKYEIVAGVDAEFTVFTSPVTFAVGPNDAPEVDAQKQPLKPERPDGG